MSSFVLRSCRRFPLQGSVTYNAGHFRTLPPTYVSGFWSLITLLFLNSAPAYAEWVPVEKHYLTPGLQTLYVDPGTFRRDGNLVTLWQLIDFKWMQGNAGWVASDLGPTDFFDGDPQAIQLRGKAPSVACIPGVLTPYGNRYTG